MSAVRSKPADVALTVGALLGLMCIVLASSALLFGLTPLVFRSGSMSPAIPTGSLAIGRDVPASDIRVGDVVSVERLDGSRITHRVDSVQSLVGNSATVVLKGDANTVVDAEPYTITSAVNVIAHVPYAGYFVAWLSTPYAWAVGALFSGALMWVAFRPAGTRTDSDATIGAPRHAKHSASTRSPIVSSVVIVALSAGVVGVGFARADMTDAAPTDVAYGRAALVAGNLPAPTSFTCTTTGVLTRTARLSWVSNSSFSHRIVYTGPGATYTPPDYPPGTTSATVPTGSFLGVGTQWTASLYAVSNGFVSAVPLTRAVVVDLSLLGLVLSSRCNPDGTTSAGARSARVAAPTEGPMTAPAPTTAVTSTPSPTGSTSASPTSTTTSTSAAPSTATSTSAAPSTATSTSAAPTTATAPTTSTSSAPPASAFIADGGSETSGAYTASIAGTALTITSADGVTVFEGTVTPSARYGTGAVWSSDGALYLVSEGRDPLRVGPSSEGPFVSAAVSTSDLPADVAALL